MSYGIFSARDVRAALPAITSPFSKKRVVARLRRLWRGYWDRQVRRAIVVMLYALDDRTIADISIDRNAVEPLAGVADRSPG
jgi:hypothetical protein